MEKLKDGIYRICIPFENIYTSSFILVENNEAIIADSGSDDGDADRYIIPGVMKLGVNVKYLVSSHSHGDHFGGINALKNAFPNAVSIMIADNTSTNRQVLLNRFTILHFDGHSSDSLGILDTKTRTLLSFDSLQLYGVGRYGTSVTDFSGYYSTINYIRNLDLDLIVASHSYVPLGNCAEKADIPEYLDVCKAAADELINFVKLNKNSTPLKLSELYNATHSQIPDVNHLTMTKALVYLSNN